MLFKGKERFFTDRLFSWRWFRSYLLIVIGSIIMAAGYSFFADPHRIVPGGVYGTAIVIHHVFGFPTGTVGLVFNIPLFIAGILILGPRFGVKTFAGTILTSGFIDLFNSLNWGSPTDDMIIASIVSGLLIGSGLALIFKAKATTGGSDIIAQIAHKYTKISVGQLLILIDSLIVTVGVIAFKDFSLAIYALITIYITGKVLDAILLGGNNRKAVFVISDKHEEIREFILRRLSRGGTYFYGQGMFKQDEKKVIYTALSRRELAALQDFVKDVDSEAFISVFDTNQIYGRGFLPIEEN
ncbi:MAG TPA: YitT family protein [bacterium]|nr:YitT family protein [bacterium]HPS29118.1 YitT family protein [bacterium]